MKVRNVVRRFRRIKTEASCRAFHPRRAFAAAGGDGFSANRVGYSPATAAFTSSASNGRKLPQPF